MKRAVFLDRDGVINRKAREGEYVTRWEEFEILPGVGEAILTLNQAGFLVVVVSNQRCVAKGLITVEQLNDLHGRLQRELHRVGAAIDAIYYCPHEEIPQCGCRKPQPGMLFDAARDLDISLPQSWIVGDSWRDVEAGKNAGCRAVQLVEVGQSSDREVEILAASLLDATCKILEQHPESSYKRAQKHFV